jgi:Flp pilus assembly pilin Flp
MMQKLWNDESGFIVSAELVLIATILVIGMIVGLVTVRDHVVQELGDIAGAIGQLNQSYSFSGVTGHTSQTAGTIFEDYVDTCDAAGGGNNDSDLLGGACVDVNDAAYNEAG